MRSVLIAVALVLAAFVGTKSAQAVGSPPWATEPAAGTHEFTPDEHLEMDDDGTTWRVLEPYGKMYRETSGGSLIFGNGGPGTCAGTYMQEQVYGGAPPLFPPFPLGYSRCTDECPPGEGTYTLRYFYANPHEPGEGYDGTWEDWSIDTSTGLATKVGTGTFTVNGGPPL